MRLLSSSTVSVPVFELFLVLITGCVMLFRDVGVPQEDGTIRAGDQLVEVQGESVKGKDFDEVKRFH